MPILQKESDNADIPNMSDQSVKLAMEVRIQYLHFREVKNMVLSGVSPPPSPSTRELYFGLTEGLNTQIIVCLDLNKPLATPLSWATDRAAKTIYMYISFRRALLYT